jgi:inorganic pyrophosphatase
MDFWTRFDRLLAANEIVIDRPKGTTHPRYSKVIYPLNYGYLKGTSSGDGNEIDVWRGSLTVSQLVGVVCTIDTLKNDSEVKLLVGCTDDEIEAVDKFHNDNDYVSGILIMRSQNLR